MHSRAFSLAELVVSIGVLVLMFALAGQVFNLTIRSTGQAKALTNVNQLLRVFEQTLREDLRYVQPGQSLILIQGNPVNAYWTHQGKEADDDTDPFNGYGHLSDPAREDVNGNMLKPRADILMLFTARKGTSFVQPDITSNLQQVVYDHAELGEYVPTGGDPPYDFISNQQPDDPMFPVDSATKYPSPTGTSPVPAEQWHLARRSVLLVPTDTPPGKTLTMATIEGFFGDSRFLQAEFDVLGKFSGEFSYEQLVLTPGVTSPWFLPASVPGVFDTTDPLNPIARSQLDPTPPAPMADRLGAFFLPNCASFKVEWALNPRSEFVDGRLDGTTEIYWFDQGADDPLATLREAVDAAPDSPLDDLFNTPTEHPDGMNYLLTERFGNPPSPEWPLPSDNDERHNLVVFGAVRRNPGPDGLIGTQDDEIVPEDIFPGALRITIDLFDSERRLDRPIRHVMIVPVGG